MEVKLTGPIWFWLLRLVAFLYMLQLVFNVRVPELVLGLAWTGFLVFSFIIITGNNAPPSQ